MVYEEEFSEKELDKINKLSKQGLENHIKFLEEEEQTKSTEEYLRSLDNYPIYDTTTENSNEINETTVENSNNESNIHEEMTNIFGKEKYGPNKPSFTNSTRQKQSERNILQNYGKIPPNALDEEEKVLSLIFQDPNLIKKLPNETIKKDDFFFKDYHNMILKAILNHKNDANVTTIASELRKKGRLEDVGGKRTLTKLITNASEKDKKLFDIYYSEVETKYHQRNIIRLSFQIQQEMFNESPLMDKVKLITGKDKYSPERIKKILAKNQTFVDYYRVASESFMDSIPYPYRIDWNLKSIVDESENKIIETIKRNGKPEISTKIKKLDRFTHGIIKGRTGIIAGGSKVGKTTLVASLADVVMEQGRSVLIYTYESKAYELINKLIARRAKVNLAKYEYYTEEDPFTEEEQQRVFDSIKIVRKLPIHIEGGEPDVDYIIRNTKYYKVLDPRLALVFIDGIQSFSNCIPDKDTKAEHYYKTVNRFNKEISEYLGVQTILTGQLKRIYTKEKLPKHMDDIADSKGLADVADWAVALYQKSNKSPLLGVPLSARQDEKPETPFELHAEKHLGYIGELPEENKPIRAYKRIK